MIGSLPQLVTDRYDARNHLQCELPSLTDPRGLQADGSVRCFACSITRSAFSSCTYSRYQVLGAASSGSSINGTSDGALAPAGSALMTPEFNYQPANA